MRTRTSPHPDIAIVGAARSGTSLLAAQLALHPQIDGGTKKEPNYFSRHLDRGQEWYDAFYRKPGADLSLDASVSYTFPTHPQALELLAATEPRLIVYIGRNPTQRAISHYQLLRYYFQRESAPTFSAALEQNPLYLGASDYSAWLDRIDALAPAGTIVMPVPFSAVTADVAAVSAAITSVLELSPMPEGGTADVHQNEVRQFRSQTIRRAAKWLRHSSLYPAARRIAGPDRLRALRTAVTKTPQMPGKSEEVASCTDKQREMLLNLERHTAASFRDRLEQQDRQLGLSWTASINW